MYSLEQYREFWNMTESGVFQTIWIVGSLQLIILSLNVSYYRVICNTNLMQLL